MIFALWVVVIAMAAIVVVVDLARCVCDGIVGVATRCRRWGHAHCARCLRPYPFDGGVDVVMSCDDWQRVSPNGEMLCAGCIARRAAGLPGVVSITAKLDASDEVQP